MAKPRQRQILRIPSPLLSHGNWSDRDSSSSSDDDDDDFEHKFSDVVQNIFDDIDAVMYKDRPLSACSKMFPEEYLEWVDRYPHLRVVGAQVHPDEDPGFQSLNPKQRTLDSVQFQDETGRIPESVGSSSLLTIYGTSLNIQLPDCNSNEVIDLAVKTVSPGDIDEVFAQDGQYEELIVVDYSDALVKETCLNIANPEVKESKINIFGNPQIRENLVDILSSKLWEEVILWMKPLLAEFVEHVHRGTPTISSHNTAPPVLPPSRATKPQLAELSHFRLSTAPSRSLASTRIDDILSVSPKIIQSRRNTYGVSYHPDVLFSLKMNNNVGEQRVGINRPRRIPASGRLAPLTRTVKPSTTEKNKSENSNQDNLPNLIASAYKGRRYTLPPIEANEVFHLLESQKDKNEDVVRNLPTAARRQSEILTSVGENRMPSNDLPHPLQWQRFSLDSSNGILPTTRKLPIRQRSLETRVEPVKPPEAVPSSTLEESLTSVCAVASSLVESPSPSVEAVPSPLCPQKATSPSSNRCSSNESWSAERTPELLGSGVHQDTVEPFVSWLLNQVQINACKASDAPSSNQKKNRSTS